MILNTGGRTDTGNYFSEWLLRRFEEGYVYARSPLFPKTVIRYRLTPDVVDCVVFCSKNYAPILPRLHEISDRFRVFCHYTITAYGRDIEPRVPSIQQSMDTLKRLADIVGPQRIAWRYGPVMVYGDYTMERHIDTFGRMASELAPHVNFCLFSFVEMYRKLENNMPDLKPVSEADKQRLAAAFGEIAAENGLKIQTCGTAESYERYGIARSGCMTSAILGEALGVDFKRIAHRGSRKGCGCMPSRDIGAYETCPNGCRYCYANKDHDRAMANYSWHSPLSPVIIGEIAPDDIVKDAVQESFLATGYPSLFTV